MNVRMFGASAMRLQAEAKVLVTSAIDALAAEAADKYAHIIDCGGRPDLDEVASDVGDLSYLVETPMFRAVVALAYADCPYATRRSLFDAQIKREAEYAIYDMIISSAVYRRRVERLDAHSVVAEIAHRGAA